MKRFIIGLVVGMLIGGGFTPTAEAGPAYRLLLRRANCILFGSAVAAPQTDPALVALLTRVSAQQDALAAQQQALALQMAQQRTQQAPAADPQMVALLSQLTARQDTVIDLLRQGKTTDPALQASLQQLVVGQERILTALQGLEKKCERCGTTAPQPPVVIVPPTNPTGVPVAGPMQPLPSPGGPLQVLPGPGGSLQVLPSPGTSIQAVPGPGGSIQLLPGVKPPDKPDKVPATGTTIQPLPDGSGVQIVPGGGPMQPLPGAGTSPGTVFKHSTVYRR